jgi:sugar lactone lactonase YvrE
MVFQQPLLPVHRSLILFAVVLLAGSVLAQDMPLSQVLIEGEDWRLVGEGYKFTEGPAVNARGEVYFTDVPDNRIYKVSLDGKVTIFADQAARPSGMMFAADGRLIANRGAEKRIVAYHTQGPDAGKFDVLVEDADCNDLVVAATGDMYYTDVPRKAVVHVNPKGEKRIVAEGWRPNGVILWQDQGTLVVTDSDADHLWTFRVETDGSLRFKERYYHPLVLLSGRNQPGRLQPGSDGMTMDDAGRLYVATHAGVQMFDPTGRLGGVIAKPQNRFLSNVVFGGAGFDELYATCSDKVYKRKLKTKGTPYFLLTKR